MTEPASDELIAEIEADYWRLRPVDILAFIARIRQQDETIKRMDEALEQFDIEGWVDERGWTDKARQHDPIRVWFGPSDFRAARAARKEQP